MPPLSHRIGCFAPAYEPSDRNCGRAALRTRSTTIDWTDWMSSSRPEPVEGQSSVLGRKMERALRPRLRRPLSNHIGESSMPWPVLLDDDVGHNEQFAHGGAERAGLSVSGQSAARIQL